MKVRVTDMVGTVHEVDIDFRLFDFTEEELNENLQRGAGVYSWYKARWFDAQHAYKVKDTEADAAEAAAMVRYREAGDAIELAKQRAKSDLDVVRARIEAHEAQRQMGYIESMLRGLDKKHEDVLNLGYNVRKEMDLTRSQHIMESKADRWTRPASPKGE